MFFTLEYLKGLMELIDKPRVQWVWVILGGM